MLQGKLSSQCGGGCCVAAAIRLPICSLALSGVLLYAWVHQNGFQYVTSGERMM